MNAEPLVSTAWLAERLNAPGVKVADATFFLPGQGDARAEYLKAHVPGAVFFDIDVVADKSAGLPHMLPSAEGFAAGVGALGISSDDHVVAYGVAGPRVWWMFRAMGHDKVSVLDGGLAKWIAEGRPTESGEAPPAAAVFAAEFRPELYADFGAVRETLAAGGQVADARPAGRFTAETPEPRAGLRSGHMPGAKSLPSSGLYNPDGALRPDAELALLFGQAGLDRDQPLTASCGSGVTACMIALANARLGRWDTRVYDGSWTEWGGRPDADVVTGP